MTDGDPVPGLFVDTVNVEDILTLEVGELIQSLHYLLLEVLLALHRLYLIPIYGALLQNVLTNNWIVNEICSNE